MFAGITPNIKKFPLGRLVKLWDNGYTYNDKPLIGFAQKGREQYGICKWVENGEIKQHNVLNYKTHLTTYCYKELISYQNKQPSDYENYRTIDELRAFKS